MSYTALGSCRSVSRSLRGLPLRARPRGAHALGSPHPFAGLFRDKPAHRLREHEKEAGGKSALKVTVMLVKEPIMSISASPAVIIRLIAKGRPTILYDEIDGVFGNAEAQEANGDLRSV